MTRTFGYYWMIGAAALGLSCMSPVRGDVTPEQVNNAIEKAKDYIYKSEQGNNWEMSPARTRAGFGGDEAMFNLMNGQWGGRSALAVYALLAAGENPQDPRMQQAIEFLESAELTGVYGLGMRANVWEQLPQTPAIKACIEKDGNALLHAVRTTGPLSGLYDYETTPQKESDHSVSQYGVLGIWACAESDFFEVPEGYWKLVEDGWNRDQDPSGGWYYGRGGKTEVTGSMTTAGIATLFIVQDFLHASEQIPCRGNFHNPHIDAGMKWMTDHFKDAFTTAPYYTWYGVERVGVASGYKYFGTVNWFKEGAQFLVANQGPDGGWSGSPLGFPGSDFQNACFALLFLVRGRAPVMMNKLQYDIYTFGDKPKEANWNERSRDAANLTKWCGKQSERFLNWQIVNTRSPMDDLHEAPILYIAGDHQGLSFSKEEEATLKQFVEEGGLIVGNSDCASAQFATAFRKLGTKLFPASEFHKLPQDHLLFHNQFDRKKWGEQLNVEGLSNGARELMLLFPTGDPARFWQSRTTAAHEATHQFMMNVYLYATDKQPPHYKGESYVLRPNASAATSTIKVARLQYAGNWDPEPGGWRRLAAYMHNTNATDLDVQPVMLGEGKLGGYKVAHLTGTFKWTPTSDEQAEIKKFVEGGGTLIIDSCGGGQEFTASAQQALEQIFGAGAADLKTLVKVGDPMFQSAASKIEGVGYRNAALKILGGKDMHMPRVRAIEINGRAAVIFSPEDLSEGLVGQYVDGIYGYQPQATKTQDGHAVAGASEIMASLLMYADGRGPASVR